MPKIKKRNRNGKVRSDKSKFSYVPERKTCFNYGNSNHLALHCRMNKKDLKYAAKSQLSDNTAKIGYILKLSSSSINHSQNACRTFHQVYVRKNVILLDINKRISSSQKQTANTNSDKISSVVCVNNVKKFKQVWIRKTNRTNKK